MSPAEPDTSQHGHGLERLLYGLLRMKGEDLIRYVRVGEQLPDSSLVIDRFPEKDGGQVGGLTPPHTGPCRR